MNHHFQLSIVNFQFRVGNTHVDQERRENNYHGIQGKAHPADCPQRSDNT